MTSILLAGSAVIAICAALYAVCVIRGMGSDFGHFGDE